MSSELTPGLSAGRPRCRPTFASSSTGRARLRSREPVFSPLFAEELEDFHKTQVSELFLAGTAGGFEGN